MFQQSQRSLGLRILRRLALGFIRVEDVLSQVIESALGHFVCPSLSSGGGPALSVSHDVRGRIRSNESR